MKPLTQLPDGAEVFIDTNIFVLAGAAGNLGAQCQDLLRPVLRPGPAARGKPAPQRSAHTINDAATRRLERC